MQIAKICYMLSVYQTAMCCKTLKIGFEPLKSISRSELTEKELRGW